MPDWPQWMDRLRSGLGGPDPRYAEERKGSTDDGYGGLFRAQDAKRVWNEVMGSRLARREQEGDSDA